MSMTKKSNPPVCSVDDLHKRGNALYKSGDIQGALNDYEAACVSLRASKNDMEKFACILSNMSQGYLKLRKYRKCIRCATEALELGDSSSRTKTLFRRAQALSALDRFDKAEEDFREILLVADDELAEEVGRMISLLERRRVEELQRQRMESQLEIVTRIPKWCSSVPESDLVPVPIPKTETAERSLRAPIVVQTNIDESSIPAKRYVPKGVRLGLLKIN